MRRRDMPFDLPEMDNIDETDYPSDELSRATDAMDYFGGDRHAAKREYPSNYGRIAPFPVDTTGRVTGNVQLISERVGHPSQWVITVTPMTLAGSRGVIPWRSPVDAQVNQLPVGAFVGTVPAAAQQSLPYQLDVSWGAGGAINRARMDYPLAGGTFGLLADMLDVNVISGSSALVLSPENVPVFGAFMVPGQSSSESTMRFLDAPSSVAQAVGDFAFWAVKPFARSVYITQLEPSNAAVAYSVEFLDGAGSVAWATFRAVDGTSVPQPLPVPSSSVYMRITNLTAGLAGQRFRPLWTIELT